MPQVFQTKPDDPREIDIGGAGSMFPHATGGVPVEQAALSMQELQEHNPDGTVTLGADGQPIPLTGSALSDAAAAWATARGFDVNEVAQDAIDHFPEDTGRPADRPALADVSSQFYEDTYAHLVHQNGPEVMSGLPTTTGVVSGVTAPEAEEAPKEAAKPSRSSSKPSEGGDS